MRLIVIGSLRFFITYIKKVTKFLFYIPWYAKIKLGTAFMSETLHQPILAVESVNINLQTYYHYKV